MCYGTNGLTWGLLRGLGLDAHIARSTVTSSVTAEDNHAVILIRGLEQGGDLFLVDCGSGFATFRAISLDFAEESPVFNDSFLEYKYIRHEGKILRMHGKGDLVRRNNPPVEGLDFIIGHWRRFYSFIPEIKPGGMIDEKHFKTTVCLTPFTASPRALCFPGGRAVIIVHNKLIIENDAGELVTTVLKSDEEILEAYRHHFPQLKQDEVQRALAVWRSSSKS